MAQTIGVIVIVAACGAYLVRRWYLQWSGRGSACGGCSGECQKH